MADRYRYILRYYIDPGFHEEERIAELVQLCREGKIAEVMFFHNPEELFQGYPPAEEYDNWISLAQKTKKALNDAGIDMSVNPWVTTVHVARGRKLPPETTFRHMVGETGTVSPITACPLCPQWQKLLCDWFARIAREVAPTVIWVEDDWRLHNHEADMGWGGCFCDEHLRLFSEKIGRSAVSREELLQEITVNGNLQWRNAWLELSRETLLQPAGALQRAVQAANPDVRLGLMSSGPDVHSAEGRDWNMLAEAFSPDKPLLLRPHLPPYTEQNAFTVPYGVTHQTVAEFQPERIEIYPELENSPRCGLYSKSNTYSAWECLLSPLYGSKGITINHYDMMGNGLALDRTFPAMLARLRPRLDALVSLGLTEENMHGVDILFSSEIANSMKCSRVQMRELVNESQIWGGVLNTLGIPCRFTRQISRRPICVSNQTLRAFSDAEIRTLLKGTLVLDGESTAVLVERGFGSFIGITAVEKRLQTADGYAYEEINENDSAVYGLARPRMSASRAAEYVYRFTTTEKCEHLTGLCRYDREVLYPGMTRFRNEAGGTVIALAYPFGTGQFFMGFFNIFRSRLLQRVIGQEMKTPFAVTLERPLFVYLNELSCREYLLTIANPSYDTLEKVVFAWQGPAVKEFQLLRQDGSWETCNPETENGNFVLKQKLPQLDTLTLKITVCQA